MDSLLLLADAALVVGCILLVWAVVTFMEITR